MIDFGLGTRSIAISSLALGFLAMADTGSSAAVIYTDSASFSAQLGASLTDTYTAPGYATVSGADAPFSAVFGQTYYHSTGFANANEAGGVFANDTSAYCAGCNGSFLLSFGDTSYTQGGGVFGVGFDVEFNPNANTYAFITFDNNSTLNVLLPTQATYGVAFLGPNYFGITSDLGISSINVGAINGGVSYNTVVIDNLQIGSAAKTTVPEPATWTMLLVGVGIIGTIFTTTRRKRYRTLRPIMA